MVRNKEHLRPRAEQDAGCGELQGVFLDWSGGKLGDGRRGAQPGRRGRDHQGPPRKQRDLTKTPPRIPCALSEPAVREGNSDKAQSP